MGEIEKGVLSQNEEDGSVQQEQEAGDEMEICEFFVSGGVRLNEILVRILWCIKHKFEGGEKHVHRFVGGRGGGYSVFSCTPRKN